MVDENWKAVGTQFAGYRIEAAGNTDAANVRLHHDPTQRIELSDEDQQTIEQRWEARLAEGQRLKDLPLYRLLGWQINGPRLGLRTGLTSYKEFLGVDASRGSAPLALSAVTVTIDNRVILNQRSPAVAERPGQWHVTPAGHLHPPDTVSSATWAELEEELAVTQKDVKRAPKATGLVTNVSTGKPEVTLALRLTVAADEVLARTAADSWQYTRLDTLDWSADTIGRWLTTNVDQCVPVGHAALLLAGRVDFGEAWFNQLRETLSA